ncbi:tetratricopeptide repeat protein [Cyclobacterium plantarum]|uniref:Tetratricopeptide repeat protein n=1 Tax=Cyclobacterium plantarum TaxID=2716263 RepID=A0ABX0HFR2_9BACT|nr:tetratricopeptide repeat protein [Cyclobacterium plantarum]NHE58966.1 tetratricopeptide repeat protein [Cyclobacterium plantarum]
MYRLLFLLFCTLLSSTAINAQTPLLDAIKAGDLPQVQELVEAGADVNALDTNGATPLMWAAYRADLEMVKWLVDYGADPFLKKGVIYLNEEKTAYNGNLTGIAAGEGKLEMLRYLIEDVEIEVDDREYNPETGQEDGWTAAEWADNRVQGEVMAYLEKNANLSFLSDTLRNVNGDLKNGADFYASSAYQASMLLFEKHIATLKETFGATDTTTYAKFLYALANAAKQSGNYEGAEQYYLELTVLWKSVLGEDHPDYANSLNSLALLYKSMGRYAEAEPLYKHSMEIRKEQLGEDHPNYATSLNNLASLYESMGRYDEAEPLYVEAIGVLKAQLGEDHPSYATSLNNLAVLYESMGRYAEAEPLYLQAMEIRKVQLGEDHPDYATSLNNLASLYESMGRYDEAEPLYVEAIGVLKAQLGEDHPSYATSLNGLARLYESMGRYDEAEPLYSQGLEIYKAQLGEDHPYYATSLHNLAGLYESMGRYDEVEPLYTQGLEIYKAQLGENHPNYASSLDNLADLYKSLGRYDEAEPLYMQGLEIYKAQLGEDHPFYATSLNNLAWLYESMGRYNEAEPLYLQNLEITKKALGENHPYYATSLHNLASLYKSMGRYAEAERLYLQDLEITKKALGENHPYYGISLYQLASLYNKTYRLENVDSLLLQSASVIEKALGREHPRYTNIVYQKALLARKRNQFTEAEVLFATVLEKRAGIFGKTHPDYALALGELGKLYLATNQHQKAEQAYRKANETLKAIVGVQHPRYLQNLGELAGMYQKTFQYDKAGTVYQEIQRISEGILKSGETDREQVPRNLQASGEEALKTANTHPFINIYSPEPLQRNERGVNRLAAANFTIKGFATAAHGIKQLQVNGQEVSVFPDGVWQYPIQLKEGENQVLIKAVAYSRDETIDTLLLHYENKQVIRSEAPRRFLLSIGINEYNFESWETLNMPVKDARDLIGALVEKYDITDVDTLFNQLASFANVRDRLKHLIGATRPQDEVIIFFAGHGEYDEDFDEDGKWILANGRLGNASLAAVIEKMEAKHVLVLADACFSGSFYLKRGEGQEAAEARNQRRSRWVLASGSMETVLDQMPGKQNSPFAWHLIDFLQKAEGDVPLSTLRDHLETQVPKYTDQQPVSGPIRSDDGGEFIFRQKTKLIP